MSEPMKTHRIEGGVPIQIGERKKRLFLVPRDRADGVVRLLQDFELDESTATVPWRESVKELISKHTESGGALKGARIRAGLSQRQLAKKVKLSQSHISDMENGRRPIGKKVAKRFAEAFSVGYRVFL